MKMSTRPEWHIPIADSYADFELLENLTVQWVNCESVKFSVWIRPVTRRRRVAETAIHRPIGTFLVQRHGIRRKRLSCCAQV